jgi:hypothetical protein
MTIEVHWTYFTKYHELADQIGMRGSVYAFVWNDMMPKSTDYPSDFEGCVYVGHSGGIRPYYHDKQSKHKGKVRTHLHKRITKHHKPLTTGKVSGKKGNKGYLNFINTFGFGEDVLNGTLTGIPLWISFICPPKEDPDYCLKSWLHSREYQEIYRYQRKFGGKSPIMNMDVSVANKKTNSHSSDRLDNFVTLDGFWND